MNEIQNEPIFFFFRFSHGRWKVDKITNKLQQQQLQTPGFFCYGQWLQWLHLYGQRNSQIFSHFHRIFVFPLDSQFKNCIFSSYPSSITIPWSYDSCLSRQHTLALNALHTNKPDRLVSGNETATVAYHTHPTLPCTTHSSARRSTKNIIIATTTTTTTRGRRKREREVANAAKFMYKSKQIM